MFYLPDHHIQRNTIENSVVLWPRKANSTCTQTLKFSSVIFQVLIVPMFTKFVSGVLIQMVLFTTSMAQEGPLFIASGYDPFLSRNMLSKEVYFQDFDGDQDLDLLILDDSTYDGKGNAILNHSAIYKKEQQEYVLFQDLQKAYFRGEWLDIDGDSNLDIAALRKSGTGVFYLDVYIWEHPQFELKQSLQMKGFSLYNTEHWIHNAYYFQYFDLVDLDGDGDLDMVSNALISSLEQYRFYYSEFRNGLFQEQVELEDFKGIRKVHAYDIDFDGDRDVLVDIKDVGHGIILNHTTGFEFHIDTLYSLPYFGTLSDFDADGQIEFVSDAVYELETNLELESVSDRISADSSIEVFILDYDRDGRQDLLWTLDIGRPHEAPYYGMWLYWNQGNFSFKKFRLDGDFAPKVVIADLNEDGYSDIVTSKGTWLNARADLSDFVLNTQSPKREVHNLYPNPARESFQWKSEGSIDEELVIRDLNGKILMQEPIRSSDETIDITDLRPGIYLVHSSTDQTTYRLVVK